MNKLSSLSIFFPSFNEGKNISSVVKQALEVAPNISNKFEIIVVDDGSSDNTPAVVKELAKRSTNIKLIQHKTNLGYGGALRSGFYNSQYDFITYMDSDGQFDFIQIEKLISKIDQVDIVVGFRIKRADNFLRTLNGKLWNLLVSIVLNLRLKDIDCGFKLVKKEVIDQIPRLTSNGATISAELLVKAKKMGFLIDQVGLDHKPRKFGKATGGDMLHIFRAFRDLLNLMSKLR